MLFIFGEATPRRGLPLPVIVPKRLLPAPASALVAEAPFGLLLLPDFDKRGNKPRLVRLAPRLLVFVFVPLPSDWNEVLTSLLLLPLWLLVLRLLLPCCLPMSLVLLRLQNLRIPPLFREDEALPSSAAPHGSEAEEAAVVLGAPILTQFNHNTSEQEQTKCGYPILGQIPPSLSTRPTAQAETYFLRFVFRQPTVQWDFFFLVRLRLPAPD